MLSQLITAVGLSSLKAEAVAAAQRTARRSALYVAIGILWVAALGFLVAALTIWLSGWLGATAACIIVAAGFIAIAVAVQIALAVSSRQKPRAEARFSGPGFTATASPNGSGSDIGALAMVAVIGWLMARQMKRK